MSATAATTTVGFVPYNSGDDDGAGDDDEEGGGSIQPALRAFLIMVRRKGKGLVWCWGGGGLASWQRFFSVLFPPTPPIDVPWVYCCPDGVC